VILEKRKAVSGKGISLPEMYLDLLKKTCEEAFQKKLDQREPSAFFSVAVEVYPDELLVSVSVQKKYGIPGIAMHVSCDFLADQDIQKALDCAVDLISQGFEKLFLSSASFFDLTANDLIENYGFTSDWCLMKKASLKGVFFRSDRANLDLEKKAAVFLVDVPQEGLFH
jgi:hypothetical protein